MKISRQAGYPIGSIESLAQSICAAVLNALCYMQATQCSWRTLPPGFPRWQTVCTYLYRWQRLGVWETICEAISCAEV